MPQFVLLVGVLISVTSVYLILQPDRLGPLLDRVFNSWRRYAVALARLLVGAGLIASADTVALPGAVSAAGWLYALAGLGLVALPEPAQRGMVMWFSGLSTLAARVWLLLSLAFGLFLVYCYLA
jgi:hypothetical protein